MTSEQILQELRSMIGDKASLEEALLTFINHFHTTEVDGCDKSNDGDMLLFEWGGPFSWSPFFTVSLTRQFSYEDEDGEYTGMEQLHLKCNYDADSVEIEGGSHWFDGIDIERFRDLVRSADVVSRLERHQMESLILELEEV